MAPSYEEEDSTFWAKFSLSHFVVVETVPVRTVNRQCSSGLQAVADVAAAIKAGFYDIGNCSMLNTMLVLLMCFSLGAELLLSLQTGIGAGLESMSINSIAWEGQVNPKVRIISHIVY
jgi:acetyl-CoA acyltransferase 1